MKPTDMVYPLLLLVCIRLSVVIAQFDDKRAIVANYQTHHQLQRKVNGRRNHHIVTLHDHDNNLKSSSSKKQGSPKRTEPKEVTPKPNVPKEITAQPPINATKETEEGKIVNKTNSGGNGNAHGTGSSASGNYPGIPTDFMDMKTIFFILIGITFTIIGYFVFRVIRSKSRRKTKKYGILATHGSEVELTPLEQEDEDEDMTVFDVNST